MFAEGREIFSVETAFIPSLASRQRHAAKEFALEAA
jgi:hypothetical protein